MEINELKFEISSIRCVNFADPQRKQHMLAALQDRLDCILADKLEGAKIRSKANYLEPIDIDLDRIRHYTMVGTYDKIKVRKLYSHCMPIQFMHTCLIISLHGVVI